MHETTKRAVNPLGKTGKIYQGLDSLEEPLLKPRAKLMISKNLSNERINSRWRDKQRADPIVFNQRGDLRARLTRFAAGRK